MFLWVSPASIYSSATAAADYFWGMGSSFKHRFKKNFSISDLSGGILNQPNSGSPAYEGLFLLKSTGSNDIIENVLGNNDVKIAVVESDSE